MAAICKEKVGIYFICSPETNFLQLILLTHATQGLDYLFMTPMVSGLIKVEHQHWALKVNLAQEWPTRSISHPLLEG